MVLHRALAELEFNGRHADIAEFLPDGRTFQIKNQTFFEETILPTFFPKMKCFASFQRQLNLYNFKRVGGKGFARGLYRHELFIRDNPALSSGMRRIKKKPRQLGSCASVSGDH
ncbi:DNA binding protein [Fragilaria crotonensis]|nr:DNA binding protein [Fragilaria crotonensis]